MREVFGGVRVVTCSCADLGATRHFYVDRLGFSPLSEVAGREVLVNVGTFRLRLVPGDESARPPGRGLALSFRVHDLSRTSRELERRQVPYEVFTERGSGDVVEIHDPDGRRLRFSELTQG